MRYKYKALRDRDGRERGENYKSHSNKEKKKRRSIMCGNADKKVVIAPLQCFKNFPPLSTKHPGS